MVGEVNIFTFCLISLEIVEPDIAPGKYRFTADSCLVMCICFGKFHSALEWEKVCQRNWLFFQIGPIYPKNSQSQSFRKDAGHQKTYPYYYFFYKVGKYKVYKK